MGGIITLTIKENENIKSVELFTAGLSSYYSSLYELTKGLKFENLNSEKDLFIDSVLENPSPSGYGIIFVDRDDKKIYNINDFNSLSIFGYAKIKNSMMEVEDYDLNINEQFFKGSQVPTFYNLKSSLDVSDSVLLVDYNKGHRNVIKEYKPEDILHIIKDFLSYGDKLKEQFYLRLEFVINDWEIINKNSSKDLLMQMKDLFNSKNINIDDDDWIEFLEEY